MGRNRNMFQQLNNALTQNFQERIDKHSDKKENGTEMSEKIYSYSSLNNLRDFSRNFSNYMKENFPDIKRLDQVRSNHIQDFLNTKNSEGCSQNTLDTYKNNFNKLQEVVNETYKSVNWDFKQDVVTPTSQKQFDPNRGAGNAISKEDYQQILNYCMENRSGSGDAILAQDALGVRVNELSELKVKDLDFANNKINFTNTKGGKPMQRDMNNKLKELLQERCEGKSLGDKVFGVSDAAINKQLSRIEDKLGMKRHSNHDIRRMIAQQKYDDLRNAGCSKQKALDEVSKWLNHGRNRNTMIAKSYIKNIW
ncbi:MAG: site-specific integrase [Lachnospiraceae bacterium]|nr:site-specific integrase [Lachnospiraceae bacterium]